MHYIWHHRLAGGDAGRRLATVGGTPLRIIDPGLHNRDAGPDFFNAKIKLGAQEWAGDVELHVKASDWYRHGHHRDDAYRSVILHVVAVDDMPVTRPGSDGDVIPQLLMPCNSDLNRIYHRLVDRSDIDMACASRLSSMSPLEITSWMDSLAFERLIEKSERIGQVLETSCGDWEHAAYVTLARGLGFSLNGEPMERLAKSLPLHFLRKHSDSIDALEALLLGQSGLLAKVEGANTDSYVASMRLEYDYYRRLFGISPLDSPGWKLARTRPVNLPYRRVAMLAAMVYGGFNMMGRFLKARTEADFYGLFDVGLSHYWSTHYTPGSTASSTTLPGLGRGAVRGLLINVVAPLLYTFGVHHDDRGAIDRAIDLLESLPAESNSIVTRMEGAGLRVTNAFDSQAVIQLRRAYCERHKCLYCRLGHRLLSAAALTDK